MKQLPHHRQHYSQPYVRLECGVSGRANAGRRKATAHIVRLVLSHVYGVDESVDRFVGCPSPPEVLRLRVDVVVPTLAGSRNVRHIAHGRHSVLVCSKKGHRPRSTEYEGSLL